MDDFAISCARMTLSLPVHPTGPYTLHQICTDALDEIERLRKHVAYLEKLCGSANIGFLPMETEDPDVR